MKLVELLAKELEEWADTTLCYAQDSDGSTFPWVTPPTFYQKDGDWVGTNQLDQNPDARVVDGELSSDYASAVVTKEMWLAEKGKKGCNSTHALTTGGGTSGHIHAESMKLYAEDAAETEKPWERWQTRFEGEWHWVPLAVCPVWNTDKEYRRKPTTITIGGEEVPEPEREPLGMGEEYWVASMVHKDLAYLSRWDCDNTDKSRLRLGIVHRTKEAAVAHAKALIKVSGGEV